MARKKRDLKQEDCTTEALRRQYSEQMYRRYQEIGEDEPPSVLLDFDRFPKPTAEWHRPEYWISAARADEQQQRLLKRDAKRKTNRLLYRPSKQGD